MGSATQTPNLALSQFADDDRPTWRGDYNGDMSKIDAAVSGKVDISKLSADITAYLLANGIVFPTSVSHNDLQAALTNNLTTGFVVQCGGSYTTDQTLVIGSDCDLSQLTINYTGTGDAIHVGTSDTGHLHRHTFKLPNVICANYTTSNWIPNTRGIVLRNIFRSTFYIPRIQNFYYGLVEIGDGSYGGLGGFAYNKLFIESLDNNFINEKIQLDSNFAPTQAFCNENVRIGGSWSHNGGGNGTPFVGMRHVVVGNIVNGSVNLNRWLACSLEGTTSAEEYLIEVFGTDNMWLDCRWEYNATKSPTYWRNGSNRNIIFGGGGSLGYTVESGGNAPTDLSAGNASYNTTTPGGVVFSAVAGGTSGAWSVMPGGWQGNNLDPNTSYMMKANGNGIEIKSAADLYDRWNVQVLSGNRTMTMGSGIDSKSLTIVWGNGNPNGVVTANPGSLYFDYGQSVRYSKVVGTDNNGWVIDTQLNYSTWTSSHYITATEGTVIFNGPNATVASLPDPTTCAGRRIVVKNISTNNLTVNSLGTAMTIDGAVSVPLAQWGTGKYLSNGSQWLTI